MNGITEKLLGIVSDWAGSFNGAFNIRENGQCAGRQSTAHIKIESKTDVPGLDIRILPGTKGESVSIPACVTHGDVDDLVYNDFFVGDGADVTIVAGCGVHTAASDNGHVGAVTHKKVVVNQIINISVSHTGGNGNAFAFCAGQNADIQAGDVGFGFYFNMRGGLPPCALAVFTNVERAVERAGPVRNDAEQFFSDAVHCFPTSLLGHCVQPAAPSNNPGSTKARGPACCTTPSAMTTISSAMARMRS